MEIWSPSTSGGGGGGSESLTPSTISSYPSTLTIGHFHTCTGSGGRVNLPAGSGLSTVRDCVVANQSSGTVSVYGAGSDTVNGDASLDIAAQDGAVALFWTGSGWQSY